VKKEGSIEALIKSRTNVIEITVVAIAIGLSVNILSGLFLDSGISKVFSFVFALALLATSAIYISVKLPFGRFRDFRFDGMLSFEDSPLQLISIFRYSFGFEMEKNMTALFAENKAIKKMWSGQKIGLIGHSEGKPLKANDLVLEAIEYFFLKSLALHLSSTFNNNNFYDDKKIVTFERKNVPEVLLENRFLETFSRSMDERDGFDSDDYEDQNRGKVVMSYSESGALFDHFELILPKGSRVSRLGKRVIEIKTKRFTLQCEPFFPGFAQNTPFRFEKLYLRKDSLKVHTYKAGINLRVKLHLLSFFTLSGWQYYRWLDSFIKKLDKQISRKKFFKKINWNTHLTAYEIENGI
jgi:hypothetical protein